MNNVTYDDNIQYTHLPKWPAFVVAGDKVTEQQAAEILIRTDTHMPDFTYAGNDYEARRQLCDLFNIPSHDFGDMSSIHKKFEAVDNLRARLGVLQLGYLTNSQILSAYIGGPHGWCDWDGNIFCNSFNIGKWPGVEDVADEWGLIAQAFPFLNLRCQLHNSEYCEDQPKPVVEYVVTEGQVYVITPQPQISQIIDNMTSNIISLLYNPSRERGIPIDMLKEKIEQIYGTVPTVNTEDDNENHS